ncbi:MAG: phosphatase PAP2 family protein [Bacteroidales bacterium]|nr:phosphatase PAP2 family protein [Bacteroidales bacterium]
MESLQQIDSSIFLYFNRMHTSWTDVLFYYISNRFVWIPLYLLLAFFLFRRYRKKAWIVVAAVVISVFLSDQSCNLIKRTVQRPRPSHNIELVDQVHLVAKPDGTLYKGGPYGFPSSHAANAMALAFIVVMFLTREKTLWTLLMFFWMLLVSYSRIYLGVHYPGDIIVGWCVGAIWSGLIIFGLQKSKWLKE